MDLWNANIVLRQLSLFLNFISNVVNSPSFDISHSNIRSRTKIGFVVHGSEEIC